MDTLLCERRTYEDQPFTHTHSYSQLIIPIYGSLMVSTEQAEGEEGQKVIFIPPQLSHSFYAKASNQFFVFDVPVSYLPKKIGTAAQFYSFNGHWQAIRSLLLEEVSDTPVINQRLADLFRYIADVLEKDNFSLSLDYIRKNFDKPLNVKQLADLEHFNPTYYVEWFKRRFGMSPIAYIRDLRLRKAEELLAHSGYTMLQIAQQIGYENQETLTRLFRNNVGMTPGEYRKKYRN
jgi:AraC-like DNA-binding protein